MFARRMQRWLVACLLAWPAVAAGTENDRTVTSDDLVAQMRAVWTKTILDPYLAVADTDAPWNDDACRFIENYITLLSTIYATPLELPTLNDVEKMGRELLAAGCDEPIIHVLYGRTLFAQGMIGEAMPYIRTGYERSRQTPNLQLLTGTTAMRLAQGMAALGQPGDQVRQYYAEAVAAVAHAAGNTMYLEDQQSALLEIITHYCSSDLPAENARDLVAQCVAQQHSTRWLCMMLAGLNHLRAAQSADSFATSSASAYSPDQPYVRPTGSAERSAIEAQRLLTAAWELRPERPQAAAAMVRLAAYTDPDSAELWFELAADAQPDYGPAHYAYIWYILRADSWEMDEMLRRYGRRCLAGNYQTFEPAYYFTAMTLAARNENDDRYYYRYGRDPRSYLVGADASAGFAKMLSGYGRQELSGELLRYVSLMGAALSCLSRDWQQARQYLDAVDDLPGCIDRAEWFFRQVDLDPRAAIAQAYAETGPAAAPLAAARAHYKQRNYDDALATLTDAAEENRHDYWTTAYLHHSIRHTLMKRNLEAGQWIDITPDVHLAGWQSVSGQVWLDPQGRLVCRAGGDYQLQNGWSMLLCDWPFGGAYELRARVIFPLDSRSDTWAGLIFGSYMTGPYRLNHAAVLSTDGQVLLVQRDYPQTQKDMVTETDNTVYVQVWNQNVSVFVNGESAVSGLYVDEMPSGHDASKAKVGVGARQSGARYSLPTGAQALVGELVAFDDIQVRLLTSAPPKGEFDTDYSDRLRISTYSPVYGDDRVQPLPTPLPAEPAPAPTPIPPVDADDTAAPAVDGNASGDDAEDANEHTQAPADPPADNEDGPADPPAGENESPPDDDGADGTPERQGDPSATEPQELNDRVTALYNDTIQADGAAEVDPEKVQAVRARIQEVGRAMEAYSDSNVGQWSQSDQALEEVFQRPAEPEGAGADTTAADTSGEPPAKPPDDVSQSADNQQGEGDQQADAQETDEKEPANGRWLTHQVTMYSYDEAGHVTAIVIDGDPQQMTALMALLEDIAADSGQTITAEGLTAIIEDETVDEGVRQLAKRFLQQMGGLNHDHAQAGPPAQSAAKPAGPAAAAEAVESVVDDSLFRTEIIGRQGGQPFEDALKGPGYLIGVRLRFAEGGDINSIQPIYHTPAGRQYGGRAGPGVGRAVDIVARDGYALGAITAAAPGSPPGATLLFMRVTPDGRLDDNDSYASQPYGPDATGLQLTTDGWLPVGLAGRMGEELLAVGLVATDQPHLAGVYIPTGDLGPAVAPIPLDPMGLVELQGHYYKLFTSLVSWQQANLHCQAMAGRLVQIDSKQEHELIASMWIASEPPDIGGRQPEQPVWIGAHCDDTGQWLWTDGSELTYSLWLTGHPGHAGANEAAAIGVSTTTRWINIPDSTLAKYVCEWDHAPSHDELCAPRPRPRPVAAGDAPPVAPALDPAVQAALGHLIHYNGHWYKAFYTMLTWHDAKAYCQALGGHLIYINDAQENQFAKWFVPTNYPVMWIGATDQAEPGKWFWLDGSAMDYSDWGQNEPNVEGNEHAAALVHTENVSGWNNLPADTRLVFLCEWDHDPTTPAAGKEDSPKPQDAGE